MRCWADDSDFYCGTEIGTPDTFVLVFGGIIVPGRLRDVVRGSGGSPSSASIQFIQVISRCAVGD